MKGGKRIPVTAPANSHWRTVFGFNEHAPAEGAAFESLAAPMPS